MRKVAPLVNFHSSTPPTLAVTAWSAHLTSSIIVQSSVMAVHCSPLQDRNHHQKIIVRGRNCLNDEAVLEGVKKQVRYGIGNGQSTTALEQQGLNDATAVAYSAGASSTEAQCCTAMWCCLVRRYRQCAVQSGAARLQAVCSGVYGVFGVTGRCFSSTAHKMPHIS